MSEISRRDLLGLMATLPVATALGDTEAVARAAAFARRALASSAAGQQYAPRFFTPHEWQTVRVLVDLIIPRDARSGSATEAGVPEFMDFTLDDRPNMRAPIRDGLAWLDRTCESRFGRTFLDAEPAQRTAILDDIAWPDRAPAGMDEGVRFFNQFRDLTASGFWSSRMGVEDLEYTGNSVVPQWNGCPENALRKLGVSYEEWDRRYGAD